jgi:hypothetical protein
MKKDLTGRHFGQWTVIEDSGKRLKGSCGNSRVRWLCQCSCGETALITTRGLTSGRSTRCNRCAGRKANPTRVIDFDTLAIICPDGREFLIDKRDYTLVKSYHWTINPRGYVCSNTFGVNIQLARVLFGLPPYSRNREVDHISGDPLDNRRCNLRLCSTSDNARNRGLRSDSHTGYKGVSYRPSQGVYIARIVPWTNSKRLFLGQFETAEEAAAAYDRAAVLYHGEFARTNEMLGVL